MIMARLSHLWLRAGFIASLMLPACDKNSFSSSGNSVPSPEVLQARAEMTGKVIGPYTYRNQPYEDVKVREVTGEGFKVSHKNGNATFLFQHMPSSVQQRFGYDPNAATASSSVKQASSGGALDKAKVLKQNKVAAQDQENVRQESLRAEISSLKAALPGMRSHVAKLHNDKAKSSRKHAKAGITGWPAVAQRYDRDIAEADAHVSRAITRLSYLDSQLARPAPVVPAILPGRPAGVDDHIRD